MLCALKYNYYCTKSIIIYDIQHRYVRNGCKSKMKCTRGSEEKATTGSKFDSR